MGLGRGRPYSCVIASQTSSPPELGPLSRPVLRRVPAVLLPMTGLLALAVFGLALRERGEDLSLARRTAQGTVQLQSRIIEREIEVVALLLPHLAREFSVTDLLAEDSPGHPDRASLVRLLETVGLFGSVRLYDATGRELLHVRLDPDGAAFVPDAQLGRARDLSSFERAVDLEPGAIGVGRFKLADDGSRILEPRRPVLSFVMSARDATGARKGVFEVEYLGANLFTRLAHEAQRAPGRTALVESSGYYLEAPSPRDSWGFQLGVPPTFATRNPAAWRRITGNARGSMLLPEGLYVHRRVPPPNAPHVRAEPLRLQAVTLVPRDELFAPSWRTIRWLLAGAGVTWIALASLAWRLAYVAAVREARDRQLVESRRGLHQLSARLMNAQEEERRNISRDLHDELGQEASALIIELKRSARTEGPQQAELLESAIGAAEALLAGLHRVSARLRTGALDDLGLNAALQALCTEFEERFELETECSLQFDDARVSDAAARHVYRIVQEGLTNAFKHARAKGVRVHVAEHDDALELEISDDGVGFDLAADVGDRLGLLGMRERVGQLDGEFECESSPGAGTTLKIRIPLGARDAVVA